MANTQTKGDAAGKVIPFGAGIAVVWLLGIPLLILVYTAFRGPGDYLPFEQGARWTLDNVQRLFSDPVLFRRVLPQTMIFVAGTATLTLSIAFVLAWLVERTELRGRNIWFTLILFPSLVPVVLLAVAWITLFSPNAGWINVGLRSLLGIQAGQGPFNLFSMTGLILAQSLASTPFVFLLLTSTLRSMNPSLEEAAQASGATFFQTLRRVTLPVLLPGILAPFILIALITLEQFELPLIIGLPARINVFSYRIYTELNPAGGLPNYGGAAAVSLLFLCIGFLALMLYNRITRESAKYVTVTGKAYRQTRRPLGRWAIPAYGFVGIYVAFAAVLPALTLLWNSVFGFRGPGVAGLSDFSLDAYARLLGNPTLWRALVNTLIVATASGVIVVVLSTIVAWTVTRTQFFGRRALEALTFTSLGIPSVIVAFGVMVVYMTLPIQIYGTVFILVLAYCYRMATTTRIARSSLMQIHKELEEAASASGARWLSTQWRILLPLMRPAMLSGFILMFIAGVREFTIPLVLYSQENVVLSVLLWQTFQAGDPAMTAALATLIILTILPVIFFARRFLSSN